MAIKLDGGASTPRQISIQSDRFVATATTSLQGDITCRVEELPRLTQYLNAHPRLPVPRLLRLTLFLFASIKPKYWIAIGITAAIYSIAMTWIMHMLPKNAAPSWLGGVILGSFWAMYIIVIAIALGYVKRNVARWHGAEHMTIAAYERTGSSSMEAIMADSPIHSHCGGRFLLPQLSALALASVLSLHFGLLIGLCLVLLGIEAVLWTDKLCTWGSIPGFAQASRLLQKHITTAQPGDQELRTAQRALQELIAAHKQQPAT